MACRSPRTDLRPWGPDGEPAAQRRGWRPRCQGLVR